MVKIICNFYLKYYVCICNVSFKYIMFCKYEIIIFNVLNVLLFYRLKKCLLFIVDGKILEVVVWLMEFFLIFFDIFVCRI